MENKIALNQGIIFSAYTTYPNHSLLIDHGRISGIVASDQIPNDYKVIDVGGSYICPGLIDLQIYGTGDVLFSSSLSGESISSIEYQLLKQGCTSFYLTLATNTMAVFKKAIDVFNATSTQVALGLHLEGPFLNPKKRGAHPEELIIKATEEIINDLLSDAGDAVKMMTIAPELMPAATMAQLISKGILLSAGHSAVTSAEANGLYDRGIKTVTHLWNAMSPLHHRDTGLPGVALLDPRLHASIIVDGIHVDYDAVRISKQMMGERLFLITDAVAACDEGIYPHVFAKDHYTLPDGTLSGSALTMLQAIANCVTKVGISLDESIRMATLYPAGVIGREDIGNLHEGSVANVLVFNADFEVQDVYFQGKKV